jgi:hypothetical protein
VVIFFIGAGLPERFVRNAQADNSF